MIRRRRVAELILSVSSMSDRRWAGGVDSVQTALAVFPIVKGGW
jgi:hypothetical protein